MENNHLSDSTTAMLAEHGFTLTKRNKKKYDVDFTGKKADIGELLDYISSYDIYPVKLHLPVRIDVPSLSAISEIPMDGSFFKLDVEVSYDGTLAEFFAQKRVELLLAQLLHYYVDFPYKLSLNSGCIIHCSDADFRPADYFGMEKRPEYANELVLPLRDAFGALPEQQKKVLLRMVDILVGMFYEDSDEIFNSVLVGPAEVYDMAKELRMQHIKILVTKHQKDSCVVRFISKDAEIGDVAPVGNDEYKPLAGLTISELYMPAGIDLEDIDDNDVLPAKRIFYQGTLRKLFSMVDPEYLIMAGYWEDDLQPGKDSYLDDSTTLVCSDGTFNAFEYFRPVFGADGRFEKLGLKEAYGSVDPDSGDYVFTDAFKVLPAFLRNALKEVCAY